MADTASIGGSVTLNLADILGHPRGGTTGSSRSNAAPRSGAPSVVGADELAVFRAAVFELALRERNMLNLYQGSTVQEAFHASFARERLVRAGNRAGKTECCSVEIARAALRRDPYNKYPKTGRIWIVGKDRDHIADTLVPKLFKPRANLQRIRDKETGRWRMWLPWSEEDKARAGECEPIEALIPERYWDGKPAWEIASRGVMSQLRLKTGWELTFFTGGATPPAGADVDLVWFDEEISNLQWYTEMAARLLDRKGRFIWSALGQVGGDAMWSLHLRAESERVKPKEQRIVEEFHLSLADNPYIDPAEKELLRRKFESNPQEYRIRILGEYMADTQRVYPTYSLDTHGCEAFNVPSDWCKYVIIDPGVNVCGGLFVAVAPTEDKVHGGHVYVYDEMYIERCDLTKFAKMMAAKIGHDVIEAFIIDFAGSRRTEVNGLTIAQQYEMALAEEKVFSLSTGSGFIPGLDSVEPGVVKVTELMIRHGASGKPRLQLMRGKTQNLDNELLRYRNIVKQGRVTDKPNQVNNHLCDCLRYAAAHGVPYVAPRRAPRKLNSQQEWLRFLGVKAGSGNQGIVIS